jgi:hypothetical protein
MHADSLLTFFTQMLTHLSPPASQERACSIAAFQSWHTITHDVGLIIQHQHPFCGSHNFTQCHSFFCNQCALTVLCSMFLELSSGSSVAQSQMESSGTVSPHLQAKHACFNWRRISSVNHQCLTNHGSSPDTTQEVLTTLPAIHSCVKLAGKKWVEHGRISHNDTTSHDNLNSAAEAVGCSVQSQGLGFTVHCWMAM